MQRYPAQVASHHPRAPPAQPCPMPPRHTVSASGSHPVRSTLRQLHQSHSRARVRRQLVDSSVMAGSRWVTRPGARLELDCAGRGGGVQQLPRPWIAVSAPSPPNKAFQKFNNLPPRVTCGLRVKAETMCCFGPACLRGWSTRDQSHTISIESTWVTDRYAYPTRTSRTPNRATRSPAFRCAQARVSCSVAASSCSNRRRGTSCACRRAQSRSGTA